MSDGIDNPKTLISSHMKVLNAEIISKIEDLKTSKHSAFRNKQ